MRALALLLLAALAPRSPQPPETLRLTHAELRDKIRGGWAGQTIGVTYGGPTEFQYNGTMIQDYEPIPWYDGYLAETFERVPGLYDDIYMDLTFVEVLEAEGLDAKAEAFAQSFAHRDYQLWHANQMARYNILRGIGPPRSGHWLSNPEADSIDFQIEADFAGLMSPGMPNAAAEMSDRVGHVMNYGDGWYGGVYVAAMYANAFATRDVARIVEESLELIPAESTFHQAIADVIRWHRQYPDDWKRTWFEIEKKWTSDVGSPVGVFRAFNIDAKLNAAYVVLGLLYGGGDFSKSLEIATRAGQDSDCNPATVGGILGVVYGYDAIPAYWKQGLAAVEPLDFPYTKTSLQDAYELSYRHALAWVERHGATVTDGHVEIPLEAPVPVPLEQSFFGHHPTREILLKREVRNETSFSFEGIGFAAMGETRSVDGRDHVLRARLYVDGQVVEEFPLPTALSARRFIPLWRYQLEEGEHEVRVVLENGGDDAYLYLDYAIVYGAPASRPD